MSGSAVLERASLRIETPRVFLPMLAPNKRYRGLYGGRGSGKSWFFASLLIERCILDPTIRAVCVREVQKSLDQSVKKLLEDMIQRMGVGHLFNILNTHIETYAGGRIIFQGMQTHTAESIKSLEGISVAWVEEAQSLSEQSLTLLRPTIRGGLRSEMWFSWNPSQETDPVDEFLRGPHVPPDSVVVPVTYRDNPWLPAVLRDEIAFDYARNPVKFEHVWMGGYERAAVGGIFQRGWFQVVDAMPVQVKGRCRFWDCAATAGGGDYTVGTRVAMAMDDLTYVECVVRGQWSPHDVDKHIKSVAEIDRRDVMIREEREGGSSGKSVIAYRARQLAGFDYRGELATGPKASRWQAFAAQAEAGNVRILRAPWNADWLDELARVSNDPKTYQHDDQADSVAGAFNALTERKAAGGGPIQLRGF